MWDYMNLYDSELGFRVIAMSVVWIVVFIAIALMVRGGRGARAAERLELGAKKCARGA